MDVKYHACWGVYYNVRRQDIAWERNDMKLKRTAFLLCLALFNLTLAIAQNTKIPEGVRYKSAPDELNQKAKAILENLFSLKIPDNEAANLFSDVIVCAPSLWQEIKDEAKANSLEGNVLAGTDFEIGADGKPKQIFKDGRFFKTKDQQRLFWKIFSQRMLKDKAIEVRRPTTSEIKYYWATIPFDIDEPLLAVEVNKKRFIVDFNVKDGEPKLFWVGTVGDL
jgi:hypothetical protein